MDDKIVNMIDYIEYFSDKLMNTSIDVSIFCLTYNHKKYLRKAFDSFIMQKFNGNIEICVYDDASSDGTTEIVKEYSEKYPDIFHSIIGSENIFSKNNRNELLYEIQRRLFRGKYIALCEGDDYWIYDKKIQRQFDFMNQNKSVALCFHNSIRYNETSGEIVPQILDMDSGVISKEENVLNIHGFPPTASYFYRREYDGAFSQKEFYNICPVGDQPLRLWCGYNGDIYYFDKCWSVRNYLHHGSWNVTMTTNNSFRFGHYRNYLLFIKEIDDETNFYYHTYLYEFARAYCACLSEKKLANEMTCSEYEEWILECKNNCKNVFDSIFDEILINRRRRCADYDQYLFDKLLKNEKRIVIYGAGVEAKKLAMKLDGWRISFETFVVTKKLENKASLMGHPIEEFQNDKYIVLLGLNETNGQQVVRLFSDNNVVVDIL